MTITISKSQLISALVLLGIGLFSWVAYAWGKESGKDYMLKKCRQEIREVKEKNDSVEKLLDLYEERDEYAEVCVDLDPTRPVCRKYLDVSERIQALRNGEEPKREMHNLGYVYSRYEQN